MQNPAAALRTAPTTAPPVSKPSIPAPQPSQIALAGRVAAPTKPALAVVTTIPVGKPNAPISLGKGLQGSLAEPSAASAPPPPPFPAQTVSRTSPASKQGAESSAAGAVQGGGQIFFGKDPFKPERQEGQVLIAHELPHTIQQGAAIQRSEDASVTQQAPVQVQRAGEPDRVHSFIANKAADIPGFPLLTQVIGYNPITNARVDRNVGNILKEAIKMIPGGESIINAINNYGIFDKISQWALPQFDALKGIGSSILANIEAFIKGLDTIDILLHPGDVWERGKRIVTDAIDRIKAFATGLKSSIVSLIKDAILKPIAAFAKANLPNGYDILCAVLGKDPISGEPVPSTAENLIAPFMKLIGQEEVWNTMKEAKAIPRAWAWFQGALGKVKGFVQQIPTLFMNALKSLDVMDIVMISLAFTKLAGVFGGFVGVFIDWAGTAVWNLLEIIFDVVSPAALVYIKKTGAAFKGILKNPMPFVMNLVNAAKLGFQNFANNFGTHLKTGLIDWLVGALPGVYIPKAFELGEIVKFAFSVLSISWQIVRGKLVKVVGEPAVKAMETGFDIVVTLVKDGPAAAWDKIKDELVNLKDMVIGGITGFVTDTVVKKAVPKLISMFIPGAGFISAILSIYDTIMVFVNKLAQIGQVVIGFIDSLANIAAGAIGAAATRVETTLTGIMSLAIGFLAGFVGLGKVSDKIMDVFAKVRGMADKALDALVAWIVKMAKKLFGKGKIEKPLADSEEHKKAVEAGLSMLTSETNKIAKEKKIEKEQAKKVAAMVKQANPVFKNIGVIDGKDSWDYVYEASPKKEHKGAHKGSGQLKIVKVNIKDPNIKSSLAGALSALSDRGKLWAANAKKFVDKLVLQKISNRVGAPIEPRDQYHKMDSAQYLARLNYEKNLSSFEPFSNRPDAIAEIMTPPGQPKQVAQVVVFEFTMIEDFFATDAKGKKDKEMAEHKITQYFTTVSNLLANYGKDTPIVYYFVAPREPTDDTKDYIVGILKEKGATNVKVEWIIAK